MMTKKWEMKKATGLTSKKKKNLNAECEELFLTDSFTIIACLPVALLSFDQLWQYFVSLWLFEIPIERLREFSMQGPIK